MAPESVEGGLFACVNLFFSIAFTNTFNLPTSGLTPALKHHCQSREARAETRVRIENTLIAELITKADRNMAARSGPSRRRGWGRVEGSGMRTLDLSSCRIYFVLVPSFVFFPFLNYSSNEFLYNFHVIDTPTVHGS